MGEKISFCQIFLHPLVIGLTISIFSVEWGIGIFVLMFILYIVNYISQNKTKIKEGIKNILTLLIVIILIYTGSAGIAIFIFLVFLYSLFIEIIKTSNFADKKKSKRTLTAKDKEKIKKRDNYTCQYCGSTYRGNLEVHHIVPISKGGPDKSSNLVTACGRCNRKIGTKIIYPKKSKTLWFKIKNL